MAFYINRVVLVGNLGADPEIRQTRDGRPVASFRVATSESWRDRTTGEQKKFTEWHRIVVFNDFLVQSVVEPLLHRGTKVYIEGQLRTQKWQDQSGNDRFTTEIVLRGFNSHLYPIERGSSFRDEDGEGGGGGYRSQGGERYNRDDSGSRQDRSTTGSSGGGSESYDGDDDDIPF